MKKLYAIVLIAITSLTAGCAKQLTRDDINMLTDKTFYVVDVVVGHRSEKGMAVSGVGVKEESIKKEALLTLPVEQIAKIIADEYKINVDVSDYKSANLGNITSKMSTFTDYEYLSGILLWQSGKQKTNKVVVKFLLWEKQAPIGFAVKLKLSCEIDIITATGAKQTLTLWMPKSGFFDPEEIAKQKKIQVEDVTRSIMKEEIAKIPAYLQAGLSQIK